MFKALMSMMEGDSSFPYDDEEDTEYKPYHYCNRCKVSMRPTQKECHYCGETK